MVPPVASDVPKLDLSFRNRWFLIALAYGLVWMAALLVFRTARVLPDGIQYCLDARDRTNFFHPHHIGFTPAIAFVHYLLHPVSERIDWILAAQIHNAAFIPILILAMNRLLARTACDTWTITFGTAVVACAHGIQTFATQPESYLPSATCSVLTLAILCSHRDTPWRVFWTAVTFAAAVLYHQLAILTFLPMLVAGICIKGVGVRRVVMVAALSGAITLTAYYAAFHWSDLDETFLSFLTRYAHTGKVDWGAVDHFGLGGLTSIGDTFAWGLLGPRGKAFGGILGASALVGLLVGALWTAWRSTTHRHLVTISTAWLASHVVFLLWWIPGQLKYSVFLVPASVILVGLCARTALGTKGRFVVLGAALALGYVNFCTAIVHEHRTPDLLRVRAAELRRFWKAGDLVIADSESVSFLRYDHPEVPCIPSSVALTSAYAGTLEETLRGVRDPLESVNEIIVPLRDINPRKYDDRATTRSSVAAWRSFTRWLFGIRTAPDGEGWIARTVEVRSIASGEPVLVIRSTLERIRDERALFATIDEQVAAVGYGVGSFSFLVLSE